MVSLPARSVTALVLAVALMAASRAGAQEAGGDVTFQFKFTKGDRWSIDEELSVKLALTVTAPGKDAQSLERTTRRIRTGEVTVVKTQDGKLDSVKVRFGSECTDTEQVAGGDLVKKPTALAGQTVSVRRKEGEEASVKCAVELSDDEKNEAREWLDPTDGFFPKKPVKVGDRWSVDEKAIAPSLAKAFDLQPGDSCKLRLHLKEIHEIDGRRIAEIEAKLAVEQKRAGATSKIDLAGSILIDVASGIALVVDLHGKLVASGEVEQADDTGAKVKVGLDGKGEIRYRSGLNTFPAGTATDPVPAAAGATSFGHMRFKPPAGWKSVAYSNGVVLEPTDLPPGGHLNITVMQAIDWPGSMDEALKQSWDDAARQMVLDKTMTVDGTPYSKRQNGTSFKGWEYIRGDGTLRSTQGDYYVQIFIVKINGRVERITVASKERSYRGDTSCAQSPLYYDVIQEFLFAIQFDDWKDREVTPATLKGDGIVGVWNGITMTSGEFTGEYAIFFANGQAYFASKFPIHGLDKLNSWVDGEMRQRYWGSWNYKDGKGLMKLIYQEVPLRESGDILVLTTLKTDHKYVKLPPVDGARFDGTWAFADPSVKVHASITFTPDGTFTDAGAVSTLNHGYPLTEAPGEGTYEVRNYTLLLHFKDGREYRIAFPGVGYEKGNQRPQKLVLSFNEDALFRQ